LDYPEKLSTHDKNDFQWQYGDITQQLRIKTQHFYFHTMIKFWDPEYRCFTCDMVDMITSLKEYEYLLSCPRSDKVYFYTPREKVPYNYAWITKIGNK
jgi:hypothetical protein